MIAALAETAVPAIAPPQQTGARPRDTLEVRLAETAGEIEAAQRLRYRVFYEEMTARPTAEMIATGRDVDRFDAFCDHLLVLDTQRGRGPDAIIGTYRLLRRSVAETNGGFYSAGEFDLSALTAIPGESLELGRACVDAGAANLAQKVRPVPLDELMARWSEANGRADRFAVTED